MAARKLHNLIYATIANCCLYIIVCSVALGTNKWFTGSTREELVGEIKMKVTMSYGLFKGTKTKTSLSSQDFKLQIVCQGTDGCMFSCGYTSQRRQADIQTLLEGISPGDSVICTDPGTYTSSIADTSHNYTTKADGDKPKALFINFGLYVFTIICICLGMLFAVIAGVLALYNTYRTPIQPVLSVFGLYIWNGISSAFVLLGMIMWIIEFATRLRKNAAISDTLNGAHDSSGIGSLGVSFWILILPILFSLANVGLLAYRSWKIVKIDETNVKVMTEKLESGETILF